MKKKKITQVFERARKLEKNIITKLQNYNVKLLRNKI